jgi:hypothetical protein
VYRTVGGALLPGSAIYRRRYERTATNGHLRAKRCPVGADGAADADPITGSVSPIASGTDQTQQQLFGPPAASGTWGMSSAASPHTLGPLLDARCLPWGGACDVPIASYGHMRSLRRPGTNGVVV